ncbi:MAG: DNA-3-methyladenine glycosylase 2 family protein [Agarilytica sp.]
MDKRFIKKAMDAIAARDTHVAAQLEKVGYPEPRKRPAGFEAFLKTIISQQISNAAAATIQARVMDCLPEISAQALLATPVTSLREAGMSQRKVEYAQGVAQAIVDGTFNLKALEKMDDQSAIEHIVQLRGFGVWSAEIYLMFSLGRKDIFPADDLIIRQSLQTLKRKRNKVTAGKARAITKCWAPYRSAGSLFLWHIHAQSKQN